ncbi:hypothetical protein H0H81_007828 [Sphagnurus paluster]|uniref:PH domain-containing protein n=1 Tax=Sphagnurus paluster TaxID=117069 RepID=A0A9P7K4V1_9AGAR|nr:hypothetical protein H0H81_007828 [Sphagnurus paluster]
MAQIQPWSPRDHEVLLDSAHKATVHPGHILVRNPPREQLPAADPDHLCPNSTLLLSRFPGPLKSTELYITQPATRPSTILNKDEHSSLLASSPRGQRVSMTKKRRSLQSLFIPSFLTAPPSPTELFVPLSAGRTRSLSTASKYSNTLDIYPILPLETPHVNSARDSPPPDFLLDDDPFANLSAAPLIAAQQSIPTSPVVPSLEALPPKPRSPLTPNTPEIKPSFLASPPPTNPLTVPNVSRALSSRARPAYSKPAFAPRPSLPSLDTLARMNIVITRKPRKGRVGAGLPFEPWDQLENEQTSGESSSGSHESSLLSSPVSSAAAPLREFVAELDMDFLDFSEDDDTVTSETADTPAFAPVLHTSPISPDELSYSADSETSMDEDSFLSTRFSRASSNMSSLTRSTSITSNSSIDSPGDDQWPSFSSGHNTSMSSAEDSDTLASPPDDDFAFPTSRFDSHNILSSGWSSNDLFDSLNQGASGSALYEDTLLRDSDMIYEPGTSEGTIRPSMGSKGPRRSPSPAQRSLMYADEMFDGGERDSPREQGGLGRGWDQATNGGSSRGVGNSASGGGRSSGSNRLGGRGGNGGDEDDEKRRRGNYRPPFSTTSDSETSTSTSDSAEEDLTDDYGEPTGDPRNINGPAASSDDDIPLAQRIPTALRAQNTIRRQVREERDQRRAAREARATEASTSSSIPRSHFARPPGAGQGQPTGISSSQEAALHASRSTRRPRTKTLPSSEMQPFSPDDLTQKLQTVEVSEPSNSTLRPLQLRPRSNTTKSGSRPGSAGRGLREPTSPYPASPLPTSPYPASPLPTSPYPTSAYPTSPFPTSPFPTSPFFNSPPKSPAPLRAMRSFHRTEGRKFEDHSTIPLPADASKLGRSLTRVSPRDDSSRDRSYPTRVSQDEPSPNQALGRKSGEESRKLKVFPDTRSARSSAEVERPPRPSLQQRAPVPPLPVSDRPTSPMNARGPVIQQRVFIGDMQRFNMVEIGPSTNAGDVIDMVEAQGSLKGWVGTGGWMVWEVAQDFGMERPIRSFELLADVQASWNKDKMLNTFVIKLTPLATLLSRSAMPTSSPTYSGYLEWESKRGKWSKRWLQLREHSLWLSKRENARDEVLLCSLSNFDAYFITRVNKAPRPFSFAIKSTDNLSFFENTADYLHVFSCGEKEGNAWIEKILLARSYVLYQERNVLFNPKVTGGNAAGGMGGLSRSGTRKGSSARPVQPLLAVSPPMTIAQQMLSTDVFEPGSLLHKHAA